MPTDDTLNLESRLTAYLNTLVHERTLLCFHRRQDYPVGKETMNRNAFYARVFVHVLLGTEPTLQTFDGIELNQDPASLFQSGLYLYKKWCAIGLKEAVENYCKLMNRYLSCLAFAKSDADEIMLPDLCKDQFEIVCFIESLHGKTRDACVGKGTYKTKIKNLALNA